MQLLNIHEARTCFMHICTRCPNGLGVVGGHRYTTIQGNFRKELNIAQKAEHPMFETMASLWCQIIGDWVHKSMITAALIFPWKQGQETMTNIFGQEAQHEMFSINNGLLMCTLAENKMDKDLFVIEPCAVDDSEWMLGNDIYSTSNNTRYGFWIRTIRRCSRVFQATWRS